MIYISADKRINDFCNALIRSGRWNFYRGGKHSILKHKTPTSRKALVVAVTPSKGKVTPSRCSNANTTITFVHSSFKPASSSPKPQQK